MDKKTFSSMLRNPVVLLGALGTSMTVALEIGLILVDMMREHASPYFGIVVYLAVPAALVACLVTTATGLLWERRKRRRATTLATPETELLDDSSLFRRVIVGVVVLTGCGVFGTVIAYRAYHFTESIDFCGTTCHKVMHPEHETHIVSPHANVSCSECHIGPGAQWFVKAKLSGLHQVFATLFDTYQRPIPTPLHNLRPAKDTCHTCHWPEKFFGAVLRTWTYHLPDEKNTPWTIKMLVNTGGGDPAHGPVHGIHWHMEGVNDIQYIADEKRLVIPWVKVTDQSGKTTIYQTTEKAERLTDEQIAKMPAKHMDCLDCHNRPTHLYLSPYEALDMALFTHRLDSTIPSLKKNAATLLAGNYKTEAEAFKAIADGLTAKYPTQTNLQETITRVQSLFKANFFPEMKARWDKYPDHIGHKITPGCFRCHDGKHVADNGKTIRKDCTICHTILAQGPGNELDTLSAKGLEFQHPEEIDDAWKTERCDSCHTGAP